jgi:Zn-dependent peptidase ImmA (M78 family)/transcriptional regulator with XRE-family HTH domain
LAVDVTPGERINPEILKWARETAGLTVTEAADKLGLKNTTRVTAVDKLNQLENGDRHPSRTMLEKLVSTYRRPLITFYLSAPPRRGERAEDFRTQGSIVSARDNATLDALLRDVKARQQMVRDLLEDTEETVKLTFVGTSRMQHGPTHVATRIRATLQVTEEQQRRCKDPNALFSLLRTSAERAGVFVLLLGDVGSHHSDIGEDVFRGFALADDVAPFVVINDNDAIAARPFTLMHELVHIWLGASGVSGPLRDVPENIVEQFCNNTASEFLLPPGSIPDLSNLQDATFDDVNRAVQSLAAVWKVSEPAVAYRLTQNGWIDRKVASQLFAMFVERWRQQKLRDKETRDPDDKSGPTYYVVRRHRLGEGLLDIVRRALQDEIVSHTRAAKILGVGPASVSPLLREERAAGR